MLVHKDPAHLWPNILIQLVLSAMATVRRPGIVGQLKILFIYALAGFGGGVAYTVLEERTSSALVGASAGVFGLCGLCIVDFTEDFWEYVCSLRRNRRLGEAEQMQPAIVTLKTPNPPQAPPSPEPAPRGLSEQTDRAARVLQRAASVVADATYQEQQPSMEKSSLNYASRTMWASRSDLTAVQDADEEEESEDVYLIGGREGHKSNFTKAVRMYQRSASLSPDYEYVAPKAVPKQQEKKHPKPPTYTTMVSVVETADGIGKKKVHRTKSLVMLVARAMLIVWIVVSDVVSYLEATAESKSEETYVAHFAGLFVGLATAAVFRLARVAKWLVVEWTGGHDAHSAEEEASIAQV